MKIESTTVEMFREEINTVFCLFIANLWTENKVNILKLKKTAEREYKSSLKLKFQQREKTYKSEKSVFVA